MSQIKLKHSGGNSVIIAAPDSNPASDRTLKLPSDGDGTILTTNSSVGKILQIVQTVKTDTFSFAASATGNTSGGVSGAAISASITPSSTSNKVLIRGVLSVSASNNNRIAIVIYADGTEISGSTGDAAGSRSRVATGGQLTNGFTAQHLMLGHEFLHSPSSTSSVTYSYRLVNLDSTASRTLYLNRGAGDSDVAHHFRSTSIITLEEVAA